LEILTNTTISKLHLGQGEIKAVTIVTENLGERIIKGGNVICAAGAIESARLLLASGIENYHLGRHLQGHVYTGVTGRFREQIWDGIGPGPTIAVTEFLHDNDGLIGGGMLADEFIMTPITYWERHRPTGIPHYGTDAKSWLHETYGKVLDIKGPIQDIPSPNCKVTLSNTSVDYLGMPIVKLDGHTHPESLNTSRYMFERAHELMLACGATEVWGTPQTGKVRSAGQHQAGTCRMAEDVHHGVVDSNQRVFGISNLHVCDASVHVTNGTFNPVLTIYALAHRLAAHLTGWTPN
jgi:choline dehydrogenase-like flavoprotein